MKIHSLHRWDLTPKEAIALQKELAARIDTKTPLKHFDLVAGADVSYARFSNVFYAGVVVVRVADGAVVERQGAVRVNPFPYIPGLLSFRETPALLDAFAKIESKPDVVMFDGHGYSHPRRMGITCHLGLWLDHPTVGCAKSRLVGEVQMPALRAGSTAPLLDRGEVIGEVLRTKNGVQPVFVSAGHRIDLECAVRVVQATCRGYRVPEPTRQAHLYVNELRRAGT